MEFFEFANDLEQRTVDTYRELANQCRANEGVKNILLMLVADHDKHVKTLEKMKTKAHAEMTETGAFREARKLFDKMQKDKDVFSCDVDQLQLYRDARDLVQKKKQFYEEMIDRMDSEENKNLLKQLVEEERKQATVLDNIIEMVSRPNSWLENAEFHHLDEY
ncbi:ferritin family protein [Acidobacteriota bacterium]